MFLRNYINTANILIAKNTTFRSVLISHVLPQACWHQIIVQSTPGPHLMRIHLVQYSTSARYEKYSNIHLVRPIIHLVRIFALSE